ncbi:hypothetical protein [Streptomyces sp. CB03238]|uniref:hypothetical protein n=1 Tax=Streptomyces sp. CB03238 TaxID=1907777 RepID=UPI000A109354|nr:hypothetical protein [Streptomyces sp. CB03238]ORT58054.1 hypothetical protein BKD26_19220 [Streptomyces sp. CB03238]
MSGSAGERATEFGVTAGYSAIYVGALYLIVTGFAVDPSGCGGRFQRPCEAETYWRIGLGFGLPFVVAPVLYKVLPDTPVNGGAGRAASIAALLFGAVAGIGLSELSIRTVT